MGFDFNAGDVIDDAFSSTYDAVEDSSLLDDVVDFGTNVFDYINTNQWAADALKGVAAGGGAYMLQKDKQDFEEKMEEKRRKMQMIQYGGGKTAGNTVTNGLLASGRPELRDFSRGR